MDSVLYKIVPNFSIGGSYTHGYNYGMGTVNKTYCVFFQNSPSERYILQYINTNTFKRVHELMENLFNITTHLQNVGEDDMAYSLDKNITIIPTIDGELYYTDPKGGCWRAFNFIENTHVYQSIENSDQMHKFGQAFGKLHFDLADFIVEDLYDIDPDLHNTEYWLNHFNQLVKSNPCRRGKKASKEIDLFRERSEYAPIISNKLASGELLRVAHNDANFNNVLIDKDTDEIVCVIDFDMAMPGSYLYDYGEAIRIGANPSNEDETDLDQVYLNLDRFDAFTKGYLEKAKGILTAEEIRLLPFSVKLMTYEKGIKYLCDFLNGDKLFKTTTINQNLDRARNQLKLLQDIESKTKDMEDIIKKYL